MERGFLRHAVPDKRPGGHCLFMGLDSHYEYQVLAHKPYCCILADSLYRLGEHCCILELLHLEIESLREAEKLIKMMEPAFSRGYLIAGREDKSEAREEGECEQSDIQDATTRRSSSLKTEGIRARTDQPFVSIFFAGADVGLPYIGVGYIILELHEGQIQW